MILRKGSWVQTVLEPRRAFGSFLLVRKIAEGRVGEIWAAEEMQQTVALKILKPELARDEAFLGVYRTEMERAFGLRHENILRTFGWYEVGDHIFTSMELLDGLDLRSALSALARKSEPILIPWALFVAREVARALGYAHGYGRADRSMPDLVHRDVSPHNIFLTRDGTVKVLDFGSARAMEHRAQHRGWVPGKAAYLAPEQALGVGVTSATDMFALGIVLWEMLAMRRLFSAPSEEATLELIVGSEAPPVRMVNPVVPLAVDGLVQRMLAPRAPSRPRTMVMVVDELDAVLNAHYGFEDGSHQALSAWMTEMLASGLNSSFEHGPHPRTDRSRVSDFRPEPRPLSGSGMRPLRESARACVAGENPGGPSQTVEVDPSRVQVWASTSDGPLVSGSMEINILPAVAVSGAEPMEIHILPALDSMRPGWGTSIPEMRQKSLDDGWVHSPSSSQGFPSPISKRPSCAWDFFFPAVTGALAVAVALLLYFLVRA